MRKLTGHDLFMGLRIVNATGIKDKFKEIARKVGDGELTFDQKEIGIEFILETLSAAGDERAEKAVFEFLAGPMETTAKELSEMELLELFEEVRKLGEVIDAEAWRAFFAQLGKMIKS